MNRLFLINERYYVIAFDYYDAITKFKNYQRQYDEDIVEKIELISNEVIDRVKDIDSEEDENV